MQNKKSILYITSTLVRSGPTNQLYNLVKYLNDEQYSPTVLTLSPEPKDSRWNDFNELGIDLRSLNQSRVSGFFLNRGRLQEQLNSIEPNIIHSQGIRGDSLNASLKTKKPKIATIHNFPQFDYPMRYGKILGTIMKRKHLVRMKKLNICVGVSDAVAGNLVTEFSLNNITAVKNGVDIHEFYPVLKNKKNSLRKELKLPINTNIWIATGHLSNRKDPISIIRGFRAAFGSDDNQFLLFLGEGELKENCCKLTKDMKNISFAGRVSCVSDYLQASDYFISASKAEGLPMAVIEAMACGLPVLLSNIDPHMELFDLNDNIGTFYKLGSDTDFQDNLNILIKKDYEEMKKHALETVKKELSASAMAKKYQDIYNKKK